MSEFRVTRKPAPSPVQRGWLRRGLDQPGGKLQQGWAEPWFANPTKRDWLVCKLTTAGRQAAAKLPARPGRIHVVREPEKTTV